MQPNKLELFSSSSSHVWGGKGLESSTCRLKSITFWLSSIWHKVLGSSSGQVSRISSNIMFTSSDSFTSESHKISSATKTNLIYSALTFFFQTH